MPSAHVRGAVRPATREAWHALLAEGKTPSVRSVYGRVGGKYTRLVAECRSLRAEGNTSRKTYVCSRWPRLRVRHIRFRDGTYTTGDPGEQALIEGLEYYGVHVHEEGTGVKHLPEDFCTVDTDAEEHGTLTAALGAPRLTRRPVCPAAC